MLVEVLEPAVELLEAVLVVYCIHDDRSMRRFIVHSSDRLELLLARRVPNVHSELLAVRKSVILLKKGRAHSRLLPACEVSRFVPRGDAGLAHIRGAYQ